jgi:large subunit ribosomal protein L15
LPHKRGFTNIFKIDYALVKLQRLEVFEENTEITPQTLLDAGLIRSLKKPVKILGDGELERSLVVKANKFSESAKRKIEAAGGRAEEI